MKSQYHLPLSTYPDPSSYNIIDNAIDFAHQNGAELFVGLLRVRIPAINQPFPTAIDFDAWRNEAENYSHDQGSLLKKHVFRHASERSLAVRIHEFDARQPFLLEPVAAMARCFDLSLIEANSITRQLSEALLFDSGRPLVLFPSSKVSRPVETVAIGWDGSSSMARSVACSGSLLAAATKVFVISITDDKEINLADRELFASSLRWAGLEVEVITVQAGHETAAVALQTVSLEHRADLLIAGGFGHSRLREFVLGGVTRELLTMTGMPVLMAH
ncbi:universal stress protein UspA [Rhizobium sp. Leaf311]|uniref:universal stress protein n=1 Tax=Rhizobium sp. Leaf311 TaxID=1736332 RepID=UPI000715C177|nr:universal stress protein [Rhizobium sp. Leaf311]KQQ44943.1 universal stress protein UspA [Rhizobium sp. Leaf311]